MYVGINHEKKTKVLRTYATSKQLQEESVEKDILEETMPETWRRGRPRTLKEMLETRQDNCII